MLPASSKGGGQVAGFPDVCKVPAPPAPFVPTPFPNIGMVNGSSGTATKVKISSKEVVTVASSISSSKGDEPGTLKGLVAPFQMSKVVYKSGSSKVKAQGQKVVHVTSMTAHNGQNANCPVGAQVAPSQVKVLVGL